jgi:hypothetical protein
MFVKFLHVCSTFCHHRWCVGCVGDHGLLIHWWYCSIYHDFHCIHCDQCISEVTKWPPSIFGLDRLYPRINIWYGTKQITNYLPKLKRHTFW